MYLQYLKFICLVLCAFVFVGCAGVKSFPNTAQVGETVAIAAGWKHHFSRKDITVTFTPASGPDVTYNAGDPEIRAVINLYPDPLSSLVVSQENEADITPSARTYSNLINSNFTFGDKDYWQTVVFVDVPAISNGIATVMISNSMGETSTSDINVLSSTGVADEFDAEGSGPLVPNHLLSMERLDHYMASFSGGTKVPSAIELELNYSTLSGYLVNPRGDFKNLSWVDTGTSYKVIMLAANQPLGDMQDYKFYVAIVGGITGITALDVVPGTVKAFGVNGDPIAGVNATVVLVRGAAGLYDL